MATLYRNFPGRRELLEALYIDEVKAVCEAAETVEWETPGERLDAWLNRFFTFFNTKHHVAELLKHSNHDAAPFLHANRDRVLAVGWPLLLAAQQTHEIRKNLTLEQILEMVIAIATIHSDPNYVEPILRTALARWPTRKAANSRLACRSRYATTIPSASRRSTRSMLALLAHGLAAGQAIFCAN
ncbi:MAG: TetR/AcrR family transcriptional regulator [Solirubrobacteraceae bacterium]